MSEQPSFGSSSKASKSSSSYGLFSTGASPSMISLGTTAGIGAGGATAFPSSLSSSSSSSLFSPMRLSQYSLAISMINSSWDWIIPSRVVFSSFSFLTSSLNLLHRASSSVILWLDFSSCSPSRLTSLTALSRSQTKARVSFTWSVKHLMWSQSPTGITTASAPSQTRLGKWWYCDCSICSFASYRSNAKASCATSLKPPSNVHLGVVASTM
jgi:hypothetical protein